MSREKARHGLAYVSHQGGVDVEPGTAVGVARAFPVHLLAQLSASDGSRSAGVVALLPRLLDGQPLAIRAVRTTAAIRRQDGEAVDAAGIAVDIEGRGSPGAATDGLITRSPDF